MDPSLVYPPLVFCGPSFVGAFISTQHNTILENVDPSFVDLSAVVDPYFMDVFLCAPPLFYGHLCGSLCLFTLGRNLFSNNKRRTILTTQR